MLINQLGDRVVLRQKNKATEEVKLNNETDQSENGLTCHTLRCPYHSAHPCASASLSHACRW